MSATVTLKVTQGKLAGQEFNYGGREVAVIGRGLDCNPKLPDDEAHRTISRNHCLLDINPPSIRIRDFGSLNGTFVNNVKIGQRKTGDAPSQSATPDFPEYDLKDADEIKLGDTVFKVVIYSPAFCAECSTEIPAEEKQDCSMGGEVYLCHSCGGGATIGRTSTYKPPTKKCAECGNSVEEEIEPGRAGDMICHACRSDPMRIVKSIIDKANSGEESLGAVKGYSIIRELGRGGMGAVYLARRDETGGLVALKVLLPQVAADEKAREMFLREADNARALNHPNVVRLMDTGYADGAFFFTMEFCDGGAVDGLMKHNGGKLALDISTKIILQALDGLESIHTADIPGVKLADGRIVSAKGLVHRDIKPANIFISSDGGGLTPKIADVGLGKAFDVAGLSGQTMTGTAAGTPLFMPRQQVINFKYAKPDVDVWAMAATFYNMLTGKFPRDFVRGKDPWQTVIQTKAVPIRDRDASIPEALAKVIDSALIDQPEIRFKTASSLKRAMQEVL
jgi:serine/threonine-protein kinase